MLHARGILIFAKDLARMSDFYSGVLGLPVVHREPGWIELSLGGVVLALHELTAEYAERVTIEQPPVVRESTPLKILLESDDSAALWDRLQHAGALKGATDRDAASFDAVDPEGNVFRVSRAT